MPNWTFDEYTERLRRQLANGDMERVLQQLFEFLEPLEDHNFNTVVILKNNTIRLRQGESGSIFDHDDLERKRSRIYHNLLALLKDLERDQLIQDHYQRRMIEFIPTQGAEKVLAKITCQDIRVMQTLFELTTEVVIGRSSQCQIVIQDEKISRQHAKIFVHNNRVMIADLSSRNKTFIGNYEISHQTPFEIKSDCRFRLHDVYFDLELIK